MRVSADELTAGRAASVAYAEGNYEAACTHAAALLTERPGDRLGVLIDALARFRLDRQGRAGDAIRAAHDRLGADRYDLMDPLLVWRGQDDPVSLQERRLREMWRFLETDTFLISFPKCGRTWVRMMLGRLLDDGVNDEVMALSLALPEFATAAISHDDYPHWKPYDRINTDKSLYSDKKVVLLVRDPRDVLVSNFFQYTKRGDKDLAGDPDFDGDISAFIRHSIGGLSSIIRFMNAWAEAREVPRFFSMLTYEDMHRDPAGSLEWLVSVLDWPGIGGDAVAEAVNFARFDNMRRIEAAGVADSDRLGPADARDPESFKVRKGEVGGYTDYLTPDDIAYVDHRLNDELSDFYALYKR